MSACCRSHDASELKMGVPEFLPASSGDQASARFPLKLRLTVCPNQSWETVSFDFAPTDAQRELCSA